jgi:Skp family chaperone for outer membrane proteins
MTLTRAAILAVLLLAFLITADQFEQFYGITGPVSYLDESLVAAVFLVILAKLVRRRQQESEQQQAAILSMNHHVRNALQAILYAEHLGASERQKKQITESVGRIERAVREISQENGMEMVPGEIEVQ